MSKLSLDDAVAHLSADVKALLEVTPVPLGHANPPDTSGVYMFLVDGKIVYVGEAKGSQGLRDRLLRKHISGDDGHACQRAFKEQIPNRLLRREHIKSNVFARWLAVQGAERVTAVERLLIWLYKPAWNKT